MAKKIKSFVPELIAQQGWNEREFIAYCMLQGLSQTTAQRAARGATSLNTDTMERLVRVFKLERLSQLIDLVAEGQ